MLINSAQLSYLLCLYLNRAAFLIKLVESIFLVVMSEDMVKDGYEDIMNIDISSVAIDLMRKKYEHVPQLKCILYNKHLAFLIASNFNKHLHIGM